MSARISPPQRAADPVQLVAVPGTPDPKEESLFEIPAALAQRRYWLLHQCKPEGNAALNMTLPVRFRGPVNHETLRRSLNEVVSRHETLRTTFVVERGELRQLISSKLSLDLPVGNAVNHPQFVDAAAREEAQIPFNLQSGPFLRARLWRLDDTEHLLLVSIHRLISDEWSNDVLTRELLACYAAFAQDRQPNLPELPIQFADYAHWQQERLAANDFAGQRQYWQRQLSGDLPALSLPVHSSCLTNDSAPAVRSARILSSEQVDAAKALAAGHGAAPLVVFLALFNALLYRHTGQRDFLVIVPSANRDREHFHSLVGPLANPLLLRANLRDRPSFLELLRRLGGTTLDAFANQDVPFELLVDDFQTPKLPVHFVYRSLPAETMMLLPNGLKAEALACVTGGALFDLSTAIIVEGKQTRFELEYGLFDDQTIAQMLSDYEMLLRKLVSDPTQPIPPPRTGAPRKIDNERASQAFEQDQGATVQTVRPYLGLQLDLIAIWEDLLAVSRIGIRDNFFELGGTSLLALRMFQRAERLCGKPILPSAFFSNPTVETLAAEIARAAIDESSQLIIIHESGSRTPFFCLHGDLFGGGFYTLKLSRALGSDQPIYVLPPHNVRDLPEAPTIQQMAAAHLQALRAVRPHGPYVIGGFCLGGIVAYELAQQIIASGDTVEMLLIIDASPGDKPLRALRRLCESLARWFRWDDRSQANRFRQLALLHTKFEAWSKFPLRNKIRSATRQIVKHTVAVPTLFSPQAANSNGQDEPRQERDVPTTFLWAAAGYRPKPYHAPMAVLLSEDLVRRSDHFARAWQRLAHKAVVHPLKGSHLECITAHVDTLAETIDNCLRELPPGSGSLDKSNNEH